MALEIGRTVTKWIRFAVNCTTNAAAEIPIDSLSPIGFVYDETEVTAWQDAVKSYLANQPDAIIEVTGPFDTSPVVALAASGLAPALSGSHTVLAGLPALSHPIGVWIGWGMRGYWTAAEDPAFGVIAATPAVGYTCTKYVVEGQKYSARFVPYGATVPAWGTAIIGAYTP
jgi:hypothetical protein